MGIFFSYCYLFIIGSFLGWCIEVLFRRIFSMHRWVNPGFLKGPCLPLYGLGLCLLHLISELSYRYICNGDLVPDYYFTFESSSVCLGSLNYWWTSLIVVLLIGVGMTLLEFIAGLIFVKGLNIKLWDYSSLKGNVMGIICPLFSAIWMVCGALYWFFIRPFILGALTFFNSNIWFITFLLGLFYGILLIDIVASVSLSIKVSGTAKKNHLVVDFEKFKLNLKSKDIKYKKNKSQFQVAVEEAASVLKNKLGQFTYDIKRHMYINNEIPAKGAAEIDETPRSKQKELKDKKDSK
ncbi:MAG: putative ABC transporter permease [Bacilli bacterium]